MRACASHRAAMVLCVGLTLLAGGAPLYAKDEYWGIRCVSLRGENRFKLARFYAEALKKVEGLKPKLVRIYDEHGETRVYYGRYRMRIDRKTGKPKFKPDPGKDLALIRQLSMPAPPGSQTPYVWPFALATLEALPGERSVPAAWELTNAKGVYSLQVAVFYDTPGFSERRYAAEQYCKLLRDNGEEAYYYHGPAMSIVCVGAFGKDAIQTVKQRDPLTGRVQFKQKIVDPKMLALQRKYPYNLENGRKVYTVSRDPRTGRKRREPNPSFPVIIPGRESELEP